MINLSTHDADFVANVFRELIVEMDSAYESAMSEINELTDLVKAVDRKNKDFDGFIQNRKQRCMDEIHKEYISKKEKYEKAIELLMLGSAV